MWSDDKDKLLTVLNYFSRNIFHPQKWRSNEQTIPIQSRVRAAYRFIGIVIDAHFEVYIKHKLHGVSIQEWSSSVKITRSAEGALHSNAKIKYIHMRLPRRK